MLTGEEKKQYQRDYMAKKRSNKGLTENDVRPTENVRPDVRPKPFILKQSDSPLSPPGHLCEWMEDNGHRKKLWDIYKALSVRSLTGDVRVGVHGPTFEEIGEVLEETKVLDA